MNSVTPIRLNQKDTRPLPLRYIVFLVVAYIMAGLVWRGLWRQEAASFGVMWTMSQGGWIDWLLPNVAGAPLLDYGPLPYWIGAFLIKLLAPVMSPFHAVQLGIAAQDALAMLLLWQAIYRLAKRPEMQPQRLAFGGEPVAQNYGRVLADCALLLFVATYGVALHTHDASQGSTQLCAVLLWVYGAISSLQRPLASRWAWGLGLAAIGLSLPFAFYVCFVLLTVGVMFFTHWRDASLHTAPVIALLGVGLPAAWLLNALMYDEFAKGWLLKQHLSLIKPTDLGFVVRNFWVFSWPLWPLAGLAVWRWRAQWQTPMMFLGGILFLLPTVFLLLTGQRFASVLLMYIPGLLVLAPFGLATLTRGRANWVDWFSLVTFSCLAVVIWVSWETSWLQTLPSVYQNMQKLAPEYRPVFRWLPFLSALLVSGCWLWLLAWRVRYEPKVLWKSVVLASAGLVMVWVLLATLAMPWLNYTRSYEAVGASLSQHLPNKTTCVHAHGLPLEARGAMAYYARVPFLSERPAFANVQCPYVLTHTDALSMTAGEVQVGEKATRTHLWQRSWVVVWKGERVSERKQALVLLRQE